MGKIRYPLAEKFMNRSGAFGVQSVTNQTSKDCYIQNAYVDKHDDTMYVMKRPGCTLNSDFGVNATPQGGFFFNGLYYVIYNDILYRSGGAQNTGTNGAAWTQSTTPAWPGRIIAAATVFQGKMWVIGGYGNFKYADVWSTQDGVTWALTAASAPFGRRTGMSLVVFNNKMYVLGGIDVLTSVYYNDVWSSPDGVTWTKVANAATWSARTQPGCVAANGGIYVFGGYDGTNFLNDVWFTVDGITWTNILAAAPWQARSSLGAVYFNNKLYVIAGQGATGGVATAFNDVWSSVNGVDWVNTTSSAFASGRYGMPVVIYNNTLWVIGGGLTATVNTADVYSSSNGSTWTLVTTTPGYSARVFHNALVFQTPVSVSQYRYPTLWLFDGLFNATTFLGDVWYGNINAALQTSYPLTPTTGGQRYQFNTFVNGQYMLIKNQSDFWVLSSGTLVKINDPNYPSQTVPGIVVLNQYAYVMTPGGVIRACALNDATQWPALQFTVASYEDDAGVCLSKYLNYVVAFGTYTTQFYYDNANPAPGISISSYVNANIRVGAVYGSSVQSIENTLIFIGQTSNRNWGVYVLNGMNPQKISDSWIETVLNTALIIEPYCFITGANGHRFYVINVLNVVTLVYDIDFKAWYPWNYSGGAFPFVMSLTNLSFRGDYWLGSSGATGGKMYTMSFTAYDDAGIQFPMIVQTDKIDGNKMSIKYWGRLDFVADQSNAIVTINVTDDDYATFNTWGLVSLAGTRPSLTRGGASRRRAFQVYQQDSNPARWEALELTVEEGES
jgi:hypothetical protein